MTGVCVCGGCLAMPGETSTSGEGVGSQRRGWGRGQGGVEGRRGGGSLTGRRPEQRLSRDHGVRERESCSLCSWPRSRK